MVKILEFFLLLSTIQYVIYKIDAQCSCDVVGSGLECDLTSIGSSLDTSQCNLSSITTIQVLYGNGVFSNLSIPTTLPIVILPKTSASSPSLQIGSFITNSLDITIYLTIDSTTVNQPVFTTPNVFLSTNATLTVQLKQSVTSLTGFSIFSKSLSVNLPQYVVTFDNSSANAGILDLTNILGGVQSVISLTVSGNKHTFTVNTTSSTCNFVALADLTLMNLILNGRVLDCFPNITSYTVQQCNYNDTAFLSSRYRYICSLTLENNNPTNSNIQFTNAFNSFSGFPSLTIIDPLLNSSILQGVSSIPLKNLYLDLSSYSLIDFSYYMNYKPIVRSITINNLKTLNVLPSGFFNSMDRVYDINLSGTFSLTTNSICVFSGVNTVSDLQNIHVNLSSTMKDTFQWNICADIYVKAINQYTMNNIFCPPNNYWSDCEKWANIAAACNLNNYDKNLCQLTYTNRPGNLFQYANSPLAKFFEQVLANSTADTSTNKSGGSSRIIPVIISLCALLVAITILVVTICFVRRQRRRQASMLNQPTEVYKEGPPPSYNDLSHISIATTRTNKSVYPSLGQSVFPTINPNDQIAPPLYTAPSESYPMTSANKQKSATQRASILTNNTHVYETLDS